MRQTIKRVMAAVRLAERFLGPDDDWVEDDRRILFEAAQRFLTPLTGYEHFTTEKDHTDYVTTANVGPDKIEQVLMPTYQRNLASSRKYRTHHGGGKQWAVGSFVLDPSDTEWQHHVFLFEGRDGGTDIYAHKETSVREGMDHLEEPQDHAEPMNVLDMLDRENIGHSRLEIE